MRVAWLRRAAAALAALLCSAFSTLAYAQSATIETVAGNGVASFSGDGGAATSAAIDNPNGVTVDSAGNLYIGDSSNHRIRRVDAAGNISTIAGTGTSSFGGDGGAATSAQLNFPNGLAVNSAGNLYFADENNHRIRRVDAAGNISTVAGTGAGGVFGSFGGDGGPATAAGFRYPPNIALDSAGNLYIADYGNRRVRKVDASGNISTIAGTGAAGFGGDGGMASAAQLNDPRGIAVDSASRYIYIADSDNDRIRRISGVAQPAPEPEEEGGGGGPLASLPDPGLRRAVEQALGKAPGSVTEADLRGLTSLNADSFGVASLAGLEAASSLEWLSLGGNAPEAGGEPLDLSPLAGLPSLTYLDLSESPAGHLSNLSATARP